MNKFKVFLVMLASLLALGLVLAGCDNSSVIYTVTFDLNGGNGTAPAAQTANAGFVGKRKPYHFGRGSGGRPPCGGAYLNVMHQFFGKRWN